MKSTNTSFSLRHNPRNQSKDQLVKGFVVRLSIFKRLYREIKDGDMKYPEQHILIEGKRGMGKTTLLLRLKYEIEQDETLNQWMIPIIFNDEEYGIRTLYKLWERLVELLEDDSSVFKDLSYQFESLSMQYLEHDEYEKALFRLLTTTLQAKNKKLVLFIDNFEYIFRKFTQGEAHRLRKILQTSSDIRIIAATNTTLEAFYDYKHPFYQFFKIFYLKGLNEVEAQSLVLKMDRLNDGQVDLELDKEHRARIETMRRITGGVIQSMVLMFDTFVEDKYGNAIRDLNKILEGISPFFKHRMDDLSAQQQEIVNTIALEWDALSAKEISRRTRMESKKISAQLNQLVKNEIVTKIKTNTKNHLYQISERFFNIWYLMKHGRQKEKQRIIWFLKFMEEWCGGILNKSSNLALGEPQAVYYSIGNLKKTKFILAKAESLVFKKTFGQILNVFDKNKYKEAKNHYSNKEYSLAIDSLEKMDVLDALSLGLIYWCHFSKDEEAVRYLQQGIEEQNAMAMFCLGCFYLEKRQASKARNYLKLAAEHGWAMAYNNLGILQLVLGEEEEGEAYLRQAAMDENLGMLNLAMFYYEHRKYRKAKEWYLNALKHGVLGNTIVIGNNKAVQQMTLFLLAAGEQHSLHNYFTNKIAKEAQIQERFMLLWYAILSFLKDKYPNEHLKMGTEFQETLKEILAKVELLQERI